MWLKFSGFNPSVNPKMFRNGNGRKNTMKLLKMKIL